MDAWSEIEHLYAEEHRFYHNLHHISQLVDELKPFGTRFQDPAATWFAVFYHDIIYDPLEDSNEEKSAELAADSLSTLQVPKPVIDKCRIMILQTKKHEWSEDGDTNWLTDADLSILGKDWEVYWEYAKKIRMEYAFVPAEMYRQGRIKVLTRFLQMKRIYKTKEFYEALELRARTNLEKEISIV